MPTGIRHRHAGERRGRRDEYRQCHRHEDDLLPYLLPSSDPRMAGLAQVRRTAAAPPRHTQGGLGFGWHNHDFEFVKTADGAIPQEEIFSAAPDIGWEADIAWIVRGGADPLDWIARHGKRITAVHVKDIAPTGQNADEDGWADVGHGTVDWKTIWKALKSTPAKVFIMEHDKPKDHAASRAGRSPRPRHSRGRTNHMARHWCRHHGCGNISAAYMSLAPQFKGIEVAPART